MIQPLGRTLGVLAACALVAACTHLSLAQLPAETTAPPSWALNNPKPLLIDHGVGVQIYECKRSADGRLMWTFREPLATLIHDGRTFGRHYAGPFWAFNGGEAIRGEILASAPGATAGDIPLLKLAVVYHQGEGLLQTAKLVLRLNTQGGVLTGACTSLGALRSEPYSADYVFLP